jgi:hypothetical protein
MHRLGSQDSQREKPQRIGIIQYNCGNASHGEARQFFDRLDYQQHTFILIQEPGINKKIGRAYCPRGYRLIHAANLNTRVAILISNTVPVEQYGIVNINNDIQVMRACIAGKKLAIINVYNPRVNHGQDFYYHQTILEALQRVKREEYDTLLLGDFNAHHPQWGGSQAAEEQVGTELLECTQQEGLELLLPEGSITWKRGNSSSTIDLVFGDAQVAYHLLKCRTRKDWAALEDHHPIQIELSYQYHIAPPPDRWSIASINPERLSQALEELIAHTPLRALHSIADIDREVVYLQETVTKALKATAKRVGHSRYDRPGWSERTLELILQRRQARRRYSRHQLEEDRLQMTALRNQIKASIRQDSLLRWREFLHRTARNPELLWRMAKWARRPQIDNATLPSLRKNPHSPPAVTATDKAYLLHEQFFPPPEPADTSDLESRLQRQPCRTIPIASEVTEDEIRQTLRYLPRKKAPGPDKIPNEALSAITNVISNRLAALYSQCLRLGHFPQAFRHTITVALKKNREGDYQHPANYRPIALENTLGKVLELILAKRLTKAIEEHAILPQHQMGGRRGRSTSSAMALLTSLVHSAWRNPSTPIVSVLSLDLKGAYDNVAHQRLLAELRIEGFPNNIVEIIQGFITKRTTSIRFNNFTGAIKETHTGIPQGSPISPILFLFFAKDLIKDIEADGKITGLGFVDDTHAITAGPNAHLNCRRLEAIHERCIQWANRHGAKFSPAKYKLIHLAQHHKRDTTARVRIADFDGKPEKELKILGFTIKPNLRWNTHVLRVAQKGQAQLHAIRRIVGSTWGLTFQEARLMYTAIIRPTITYGADIWGIQSDGTPASVNLLEPLQKLQNQCVRMITGAYKRASATSLEKDADIPPMKIQIDSQCIKQALRTRLYPVQEAIRRVVDKASVHPIRPPTPLERLLERAQQAAQQHNEQDPTRLAKKLCQQQWEAEWNSSAAQKTEATWNTKWMLRGKKLYGSLSRAQVSIATLLRTEAIGLNDFLARIGVPGITPDCGCGFPRQGVRHTILFCPLYQNRANMFLQGGSQDLHTLLTSNKGLYAVTDWALRQGILEQFKIPRKVMLENIAPELWQPLPKLISDLQA